MKKATNIRNKEKIKKKKKRKTSHTRIQKKAEFSH